MTRDVRIADLPDAAWRQAFRRRLSRWFRGHARDLPWRRRRDPYAIWLSEIMLQQTQVATVERYFDKFLRRFPNIASLGQAAEQDVLRIWEGLGYYRRARALHQAAKTIIDQYGGKFPRELKTLQSLPGIGRYTAGAILSIAFDERHPILEANSVRLFCRLLAYPGDARLSEGQDFLWTFAEQILPRRHVGTFNQALMELGSRVCTARNPSCHACPVAPQCRAFAEGRQSDFPVANRKMRYEDRREAAVVVRRGSKILLRHCERHERWAGLWDFPRFQIRSVRSAALRRELREKTHRLTGVEIQPGKQITTIRHEVTRFRIKLECYEARYVERPSRKRHGTQKWIARSELKDYPLSVTGRKISRLLNE